MSVELLIISEKCNFQHISLKNMPPPSIKNDGSQILQISLLLLLLCPPSLLYHSCSHSFDNIGAFFYPFASCDSLKIVNNSYRAGEMYHYRQANNVPRQQRNVVLLSADASCLFTSLKCNIPLSFFFLVSIVAAFPQNSTFQCRTAEYRHADLVGGGRLLLTYSK